MLIFALPFDKNKGNDSVAQLVEQYTFNVWVLGSSPNGITGKPRRLRGFFYLPPQIERLVLNKSQGKPLGGLVIV